MFGQPAFAHLNARFNAAARTAAASGRPLILAHRGTAGGIITENTSSAVQTALVSGADIPEIDVIASTDGDFFVFHDGYERMHFGLERSILGLSTAEMRDLRYHHHPLDEAGGLARLEDIVMGFPDTMFNVDRSWRWWPGLLTHLADLGATDRAILKCHPRPGDLLALADHPAKFPFIPMIREPEQVEFVLGFDAINTVGVELLAEDESTPFTDPAYLAGLRERGLAVLVNAINLGNRIPLYAGMDDLTSILEDPDAGWGRLLALRPDLVQTDFPALLSAYIRNREETHA